MELVIVTGLSGAGKSQAANALEDIGFFCIDNMPPSLIIPFVDMASKLEQYGRVAVVTDVRAGELFSGFFDAVEGVKSPEVNCRVLFLDAQDKVLENRYRATRRKHPLMTSSDITLRQAISDERRLLDPIRQSADYCIDTSFLSTAQLKDGIVSIFLNDAKGSMAVRCLSFGFKYGVPTEADLMLDVRCLPNPFYVEELKEHTGLESCVRDYVFDCDDTKGLLERFYSLVDYLLPLYRKEGKSQLVIGVGCTGGRHRSVAVAEDLRRHIDGLGFDCTSSHRDISKG